MPGKKNYIIGIDQSTQGTKALLFDAAGTLVCRTDLPHKQMVNDQGWIAHDPEEIYGNVIETVRMLLEKSGTAPAYIKGVGISNQRETALAFEKETALPVYPAIVWQCARGADICKRIENKAGDIVRKKTGIPLSPYFSAAKIAWILEQVEGVKEKAEKGEVYYGTVDSWLVYKLTGRKVWKTDYSNASRSQMFDIFKKQWDEEICRIFGIPEKNLPEVTFSDGDFGETDFEGILPDKVPIRGVMGDSHGALFAQGCHQSGMVKSTYGTGSSVMINIGENPVLSENGVVTSLAWGRDGKVDYVLEGNINYTGAVISWLEKDLQLVASAQETAALARAANSADQTYLVPAFTGLGAPYWDSRAKGIIAGITRTTGKPELVRAALDCIAYQIRDIVQVMEQDAGVDLQELRVDGGPTKNSYLMQFQSDMLGIPVQVSEAEELSGMGAAYMAGLALGIYQEKGLFESLKRKKYSSKMEEETRQQKYSGWKESVEMILKK